MISKTTTKTTRKNSRRNSQKNFHRISRQRRLQKQLQMLLLERHSRKCIICHHPEREAIEEEFLHWRAPWKLAEDYNLADYRTIYRHARAAGLLLQRRENLHSGLDAFVEAVDDVKFTGDTILRAMRAYSCIDRHGRWTKFPPKSTSQPSMTAPQPNRPLHIRKMVRASSTSNQTSWKIARKGMTVKMPQKTTPTTTNPATSETTIRRSMRRTTKKIQNQHRAAMPPLALPHPRNLFQWCH